MKYQGEDNCVLVNLHSRNIHRRLQEPSVKINFIYKIRLKSCTSELKLQTNPDHNFYHSGSWLEAALTVLSSATAGGGFQRESCIGPH